VPELPEVERYRLVAEACALGRPIAGVSALDSWYLKRGTNAEELAAVLVGGRFVAARRRGKLLLLDVAPRPGAPGGTVLGLRFGMSGRLVCDGRAAVDHLLYTSDRADARYDRFAVSFAGGGRMAMSDPRRLGGVELDPDEDRLGPDALTVGPADLRRAVAGARVSLKARLMDQSRLAGVGNLIADEILWRAGLSPIRPAESLSPAEVRRLHHHLRTGLVELMARGGAHTGDLQPQRRPGGTCPRDRTPLLRSTVGGRTTWWCPRHQL
jgi:formamidopyrimidine-DNA glycosylase